MSRLTDSQRRFLKRTLWFALLYNAVLLAVKGILFLLSAIPPRAFDVHGPIEALAGLLQLLYAPRLILHWLWPGEQNYGWLNLLFTILNSVIWGVAGAVCKSLLRR